MYPRAFVNLYSKKEAAFSQSIKKKILSLCQNAQVCPDNKRFPQSVQKMCLVSLVIEVSIIKLSVYSY